MFKCITHKTRFLWPHNKHVNTYGAIKMYLILVFIYKIDKAHENILQTQHVMADKSH